MVFKNQPRNYDCTPHAGKTIQRSQRPSHWSLSASREVDGGPIESPLKPYERSQECLFETFERCPQLGPSLCRKTLVSRTANVSISSLIQQHHNFYDLLVHKKTSWPKKFHKKHRTPAGVDILRTGNHTYDTTSICGDRAEMSLQTTVTPS